jgi:hypothetical protein
MCAFYLIARSACNVTAEGVAFAIVESGKAYLSLGSWLGTEKLQFQTWKIDFPKTLFIKTTGEARFSWGQGTHIHLLTWRCSSREVVSRLGAILGIKRADFFAENIRVEEFFEIRVPHGALAKVGMACAQCLDACFW